MVISPFLDIFMTGKKLLQVLVQSIYQVSF